MKNENVSFYAMDLTDNERNVILDSFNGTPIVEAISTRVQLLEGIQTSCALDNLDKKYDISQKKLFEKIRKMSDGEINVVKETIMVLWNNSQGYDAYGKKRYCIIDGGRIKS
jgi:hypothetical protein